MTFGPHLQTLSANSPQRILCIFAYWRRNSMHFFVLDNSPGTQKCREFFAANSPRRFANATLMTNLYECKVTLICNHLGTHFSSEIRSLALKNQCCVQFELQH